MYQLRKRADEKKLWEKPAEMPNLLYTLLCARGISSYEEAERFITPALQPLYDPFAIDHMQEAVDIIRKSINAQEKICVYGDYDVDGVCASTILYSALRDLGADVQVYIPSRHNEGYGLNEFAVHSLADNGVDLLITVDCGISDRKNTDLAMELGMNVIVTDHHRIAAETYPRCTVVTAQSGNYPCRYLCGAATAYKLACALSDEAVDQFIDLAAIATVADCVPLQGENRTIVAKGIEKINAAPRPGVAALMKAADIAPGSLNSTGIAFGIAPRINAAGRLGDALDVYKLLTEQDPSKAAYMADALNSKNAERKGLQDKAAAEAEAMLKDYDFVSSGAIVLKGNWNPGVIGLVASKLVEHYNYPTILFSEQDGMLKGSCRSIEGIDIYLAIHSCADLLTTHGGHKAAAGLGMKVENYEAFCARIAQYMKENAEKDVYVPSYEYDIEVEPKDITVESVRSISLMEPFGEGNPAFRFLTAFAPDSVRAIGKQGQHLKMMMCGEDGTKIDAVWWGHGKERDRIALCDECKAIGALDINEFNGKISAQMKMDVLFADETGNVQKEKNALQSFLTDILYTDLSSRAEIEITIEQARELLTGSHQGTVVAVTEADSLMRIKTLLDLDYPLDTLMGRWSEDNRCFNACVYCPEGILPRGIQTVITTDAGEPCFVRKAKESGAVVMRLVWEEPKASWLDSIPTVSDLRDVYIAIRELAKRPSFYTSKQGMINGLAKDADLLPETVAIAVEILKDMGLTEVSEDPVKIGVKTGIKVDPMENKPYQKILKIKDGRKLS